MKVWVLLAWIVSASPSWAERAPCRENFNGPCTPNAPTKKKILEYAELGVAAYEKWTTQRSAEESLRKDLMVEKERREKGKESMSDEDFDRLIFDWETAYKKMHSNRESAQALLSATASLVLKEYQIDTVPNGPITGGPAQGLIPETTIKIHFPEEDFREVFIDSDGKTVYLYRHAAEMRKVDGTTAINGRIAITVNSFARAIADEDKEGRKIRRNPGEIAAILFHEIFHRQTLSDGRWYKAAPSELQGYGYTHDLADIFELRPGSESRNFMEKKVAEFDKKVYQKSRRLFKDGFAVGPPPYSWHDAVLKKLGLKASFPTSADQAKEKVAWEHSEKRSNEAFQQQMELITLRRDRLNERLVEEEKARAKANAEAERRNREAARRAAQDAAMDALFILSERVCKKNPGEMGSVMSQANLDFMWASLPAKPDYGGRQPQSRCARDFLNIMVNSRHAGFDAPTEYHLEYEVAKIRAQIAIEEKEEENRRQQAYVRFLGDIIEIRDMLFAICRNPGTTEDFSGPMRKLNAYSKGGHVGYRFIDIGDLGNEYSVCYKAMIDSVSGDGMTVDFFRPTARKHSPYPPPKNGSQAPFNFVPAPSDGGSCPDGSKPVWSPKINGWACPVRR